MNFDALIDLLPPLLLVAASGVIVALITVHRRRLASSRPGPLKTGPANLDRLRRDAAALAEELERLAHSVDRRVDERLDKLEKLLAEADRKISELNSALQTQPPAGGSENAESSEEIVGVNQRVAAVLRLSREGLDNLEIARRLGMEVGEVELTLNIYRPPLDKARGSEPVQPSQPLRRSRLEPREGSRR